MTNFLQFTVSGVTQGAIYALLALSWVLVYRVSSVLFIVAGDFAVLGGLAVIWATTQGVPLSLAITGTIVFAVVLSVLLDLVVVRRIPAKHFHFGSVILLLGVHIAGSEMLGIVFGTNPVRLSAFLPDRPVTLFGVSVLPHQVLVIVIVALLVAILWIVFGRTWFGKAMLACSDNPRGAQLVGIAPLRVRSLAFGVAAGLAATGGILLAPIGSVQFSDGLGYTFAGFIAAALGLWTYHGAVGAGLLIGLAEAYGAGYVSSVYRDVFPLVILLALLVIATMRFAPTSIRQRLVSAGH